MYAACFMGWSEAAPQDRLTVLVTGSFGELLAADPKCGNHHVRVLPSRGPTEWWRFARSEFLLPEYQHRADALLATLPTIPIAWRKPVVIVVHDLRHNDRPEEFTLQQRLTRRILYSGAYNRADRIVAISQRVADDLVALHPLTAPRVSVALHGSDHVGDWRSSRSGDAIAFGQYANKEPLLLLLTWKHLLKNSPAGLPTLHIVGLNEPALASLRGEAARLEISGSVILDGYLPDHQLDQLMRAASVLLLPSRHEGFGLPVLEAMRKGVPVVISPDRALHEIAGGHAAEAAGWSPEQVAAGVQRAVSMTKRGC